MSYSLIPILAIGIIGGGAANRAVAQCGNGVLERHESCDDGNLSDADCCTLNCQVIPAGCVCAVDQDCNDGDVCTRDQCVASACQYTAGTACNVTFVTTGEGGGVINISGATLLRNFFDTFPGSTNDWVNADLDCDMQLACGVAPDAPGDDGCAVGPNCPWRGFDAARGIDAVDQLATTYGGGTITTNWLQHYRGVGSIEGYQEFIDWQICGTIPNVIASEAGVVNRATYANLGLPAGALGTCDPVTNSPICQDSVDLGILDVFAAWGTRDGANTLVDADWDREPGDTGYGLQPNPPSGGSVVPQLARLFKDCNGDTVIGANEQLNLNTATPDPNTIFDTTVAWVPIEYLANRGVGVSDRDSLPTAGSNCFNATGTIVPCDAENRGGDIRLTEIQHLFVLGRLPNGENLVAATRDVGSGTRNGIMNTSGIDPSWGLGDNVGDRIGSDTPCRLGPNNQVTNCGGSGIIENAVRWRRLAIGYTGLAGPSRAVSDAKAGQYELLNIMFDDRGGTQYVRPSIDSVLKNDDPDTGFQLGGNASFTSVGDPHDNLIIRDSLAGDGSHPVTPNIAAAYLINITQSVIDFTLNPSNVDSANMPGEAIARRFFLPIGINALPDPVTPASFLANALLDIPTQNYHRCNNEMSELGPDLPGLCGALPVATGGTGTPSYGEVNRAGHVPQRRSAVVFQDNPVATTAYTYSSGLGTSTTIAANANLGERNQVQGDWNFDRERDINDFPRMMAMANALDDAAGVWQTFLDAAITIDDAIAGGAPDAHPGSAGAQTGGNWIIPHIIGDHDGDGNFGPSDVRYAADGLALIPAPPAGSAGKVLDRKVGFTTVDNEWLILNGVNNYFNTVLANGTYDEGDSRADIAGNPTSPNAEPRGADGNVDDRDIDYVYRQYVGFTGGAVVWNNPVNRVSSAIHPTEKRVADLSADINGDLVISFDDVCELVLVILETQFGDADLDGDVDAADQAILTANLGLAGGWADGDFNGDGLVNALDQAILTANLTGVGCCGDSDCGALEVCNAATHVCVSSGFACVTLLDCKLDPDDNGCNHSTCPGGVCVYNCVRYGDVQPPGGNGIVNLDDILCILSGFSNPASCPNADINPCGGNVIINLDDILAVLGAFAGANPCTCTENSGPGSGVEPLCGSSAP